MDYKKECLECSGVCIKEGKDMRCTSCRSKFVGNWNE
jgi:hypothetical protein